MIIILTGFLVTREVDVGGALGALIFLMAAAIRVLFDRIGQLDFVILGIIDLLTGQTAQFLALPLFVVCTGGLGYLLGAGSTRALEVLGLSRKLTGLLSAVIALLAQLAFFVPMSV